MGLGVVDHRDTPTWSNNNNNSHQLHFYPKKKLFLFEFHIFSNKQEIEIHFYKDMSSYLLDNNRTSSYECS